MSMEFTNLHIARLGMEFTYDWKARLPALGQPKETERTGRDGDECPPSPYRSASAAAAIIESAPPRL